MRAGTRFGMALKTERRPVGARNALQRTVEQGAMRGPQVVRQRGLVHRKGVVLTRYQDASGVDLQYRMIGAVMSEFHFHGLGAAGQSEQVMTQADTEHGDVGLEELRNGGDGVVAGLWIARSIT